MEITNSNSNDINEIFRLYRIATAYQETKNAVRWPEFEHSIVETEIKENHQWKMLEENTIACVWATTHSDPLIWEERNEDPSVYIHRIATNPDFRGENLVMKIVQWAKEYAIANNKKFVRLDTVGENKGLIKHYTRCGFNFLGLQKLQNTKGLPAHYENASVSLFELPVYDSGK
jgi:ribosomal protein S18 acetylase RimI-like enzyme